MTGNSTENLWYIARDGQQHGPISQTEMQLFVDNGHLKPTDLLWRPGFAEWQPAASVFPGREAAAPEQAPQKPQQTPAPGATAKETGSGEPAKSPAGPAAGPAAGTAQETALKPAETVALTRSGEAVSHATSKPAPAASTSTPAASTSAPVKTTSPVRPAPSTQAASAPTAATKPAPTTPASTPATTTAPVRPAQTMQTATASTPRANAYPSSPNTGPAARQAAVSRPAPHQSTPAAQSAAVRTTSTSSNPGASAKVAPYQPVGSRTEDTPTGAGRGRKLALAAFLLAIIGGSLAYVISHQDTIVELVGGGETRGEVPVVKAQSAPADAAQQETATLQQPEQSEQRPAVREEPAQTALPPTTPPPTTANNNAPAEGATPPEVGTAMPSTVTPAVPPPVEDTSSATAVDTYYQQSKLWQYIKRAYPDWYGEHISAAAALGNGGVPQRDATKSMVEGLVALRRQHADNALHADAVTLKAIATAFLNNLQSLAERGPDTCYGFISQGETSPKSVDLFHKPQSAPELERQALAIFEAIAAGTAAPTQHERPKKGDYDVLAAELGKLGWSQADLQLFADPKALSNASPARVCAMVRDWFKAHIAISDAGVQERLLVETLRPVVAG